MAPLSTPYRFTFAICACGWLLAIEPAARYGRTDDYWPVTIDDICVVAPPGWEAAQVWPSRGDPVHAPCGQCHGVRRFTRRVMDRMEVRTCDQCGIAIPDQIAVRRGINGKVEAWVRDGKATVVSGDDGKPIGIKMPSHEDVLDEVDLRRMLEAEQRLRG